MWMQIVEIFLKVKCRFVKLKLLSEMTENYLQIILLLDFFIILVYVISWAEALLSSTK